MKMMGMKCAACGSTNVGADLASTWHAAEQGWDSVGDLDGRVCHDCGADPCRVEEYELRGKELADAKHDRRLLGIEELMRGLQRALKEDGAVANMVIPDLIAQASAIRSKLYQYAATMAEQDELVDALALTLPYAETRAEDLALEPVNEHSQPEDGSSPGAAEAASVVEHAGRILTQHGGAAYLLERGQRAGGAE